jgi:RimJ/RimL family protein N-acetyltransferase
LKVIDSKKIEWMDYKFDTVIEGEFIVLKKVEFDDAPDIYHWRTGEAGKFMRHPVNYSIQSQLEWIKNRSSSEINYIIFQKKSLVKVGMIGIYDVNHFDSVTKVGRLLLDESYLKKSTPYGLESLLLAYEYVFTQMNFRKICGDILATNIEMFKLQKFLGMQQEGYLQKHVVIKDKTEDLFIMSIFKEDFVNYKNKINLLLRGFRI